MRLEYVQKIVFRYLQKKYFYTFVRIGITIIKIVNSLTVWT